jgi:uncharacterized protein (TIGR00661 family)
MRILYAIQGTGNGHVARAIEIIPYLKKYCHLDLFISGGNSELLLPYPIKFRSKGISFYYNTHGGINYLSTVRKLKFISASKEIRDLPVENYDLVINDFEPISAYSCKLKKTPIISFGHQAAFNSAFCPRPEKRSFLGEFILRKYAPAQQAIGLHFDRYENSIFTPIIRSGIRNTEPKDLGHVTVYLPAFGTLEIMNFFKKIKNYKFQIFSKHIKSPFEIDHITFLPVNLDSFSNSLAQCHSVIMSAGFEGPSEALFLGKKLIVVPIKGQYEQECNAEALRKLGVPVIKRLDWEAHMQIVNFLNVGQKIQIDYPNLTESILENQILNNITLSEFLVA